MKRAILAVLLLLAAPLSAQTVNLDFPGLADRAREVVDVTLDADMLRLASKFLSNDDADERATREIVSKLSGIYVRSYTFDKDGEYDRAMIGRMRTQLAPTWKKIVDVRNRDGETSEIYLDARNGTTNGLLIIDAEPRELTVVNIVGPIDLDQLSRLEGQFGIPHVPASKEKSK
jgi:Domain of unknown function (DUF4252)